MNIKKGLLIIALLLISAELSYSWNEEITHKDISKFAAENSVLRPSINYLKNIGYQNALDEKFQWSGKTLKVKEWLQEGAKQEDIPTSRSFNHFHNPLRLWDQAGLDDTVLLIPVTGKSSLLWAQDGSYQQSSIGENWSWQKTRDYYHLALISTTVSIRQENFAKTFRGLGHQMHLLQDTAVPDHVRNDAHPEDAIFEKNILNGSRYFETWAKEEYRRINSFVTNPVFPNISFNVSYSGLAPITQLYDSEEYNGTNPSTSLTQGLAEYTNANFFSGDTAFAFERYSSNHRHYFPYPRRSSTDLHMLMAGTKPTETIIAEDGSSDTGTWVSKIYDGEIVGHFLRPSSLTQITYELFGEGDLYYRTFYRDETSHEDYTSLLIPRVVGYSAGLLNYFFRGTLEISAPDEYVYAAIDGSKTPHQFTTIKAKVMNTTPNEEIKDGIIQAVTRYKVIPNYLPDLSNYPPDGNVMNGIEYSYSVSTSITLTPEEVTSLNNEPTEFSFDFAGNPIPAGITDLHLFVVFKGTLGNETENAIAVGMKNLLEPTHNVFWNLTDMFSVEGHLYTAGHIRTDYLFRDFVDFDDDEILNETDIGEPFIDPFPMTIEISYMGESPPVDPVYPVARVQNLPAGRYIKMIILLDDEQVNSFVRITFSDRIFLVSSTYDFIFEGVINQEDNGVWQTSPPTDTLRTVKQHYYTGKLGCIPLLKDPETGYQYCSYPEQEAIVPPDLTPYPINDTSITATADRVTGNTPLEVTISIDAPFNITNSDIKVTGPAQPEFLVSGVGGYVVRMTVVGVYAFTVSVTGPDGNVYQDIVVIKVVP